MAAQRSAGQRRAAQGNAGRTDKEQRKRTGIYSEGLMGEWRQVRRQRGTGATNRGGAGNQTSGKHTRAGS